MMTEARKAWEKVNKWVFSVSIMRKSEYDIVEYLETKEREGIPKGTVIKQGLRLLMNKEKQQEEGK